MLNEKEYNPAMDTPTAYRFHFLAPADTTHENVFYTLMDVFPQRGFRIHRFPIHYGPKQGMVKWSVSFYDIPNRTFCAELDDYTRQRQAGKVGSPLFLTCNDTGRIWQLIKN